MNETTHTWTLCDDHKCICLKFPLYHQNNPFFFSDVVVVDADMYTLCFPQIMYERTFTTKPRSQTSLPPHYTRQYFAINKCVLVRESMMRSSYKLFFLAFYNSYARKCIISFQILSLSTNCYKQLCNSSVITNRARLIRSELSVNLEFFVFKEFPSAAKIFL